MATSKELTKDSNLNEDGLPKGKLVSQADHARVLNERRLAARKAKLDASVVAVQEKTK